MRIIHTMLRVGDLDRSVHFYTACMGMKVLHKMDFPEGRFSLVFIGYGDEKKDAVLELTHNWDKDTYTVGDGYGHIAIQCDDLHATCERIVANGGELISEPKKMQGGPVMAFARDPDGYAIELLHHDCFDSLSPQ